MGKIYSEEQKKKAVDLYYESGKLYAVREMLGYPSPPTLLEWAKADTRWDKPEKHYKHSTFETRIACVSAYLDGGMTCRSIGERYGISPTQVSRWSKDFLQFGPSALEPKQRKDVPIKRRNIDTRPEPAPPPGDVPDEGLREYCEQLKFENDVLRAEIDLFAKKAEASARKGSQTPKRQS